VTTGATGIGCVVNAAAVAARHAAWELRGCFSVDAESGSWEDANRGTFGGRIFGSRTVGSRTVGSRTVGSRTVRARWPPLVIK
jgi:hypothetical protein